MCECKKKKKSKGKKEEEQKAPEEEPSRVVSQGPKEEELEEEDPAQLLEKGLELLLRATNGLAEKNPFDPLIFRINRLSAWLTVDSLPISEDGKTMLSPPDSQIISSINSLYNAGDWKTLLETSESHVPQFLFWLDLSRYSSEALENLGYPLAKDAIVHETLYYVKRLPGIENLSFSDGTPFADEDTRQWLRDLKRSTTDTQEGINKGSADSMEQKVNRELEEASRELRIPKTALVCDAIREKLERLKTKKKL